MPLRRCLAIALLLTASACVDDRDPMGGRADATPPTPDAPSPVIRCNPLMDDCADGLKCTYVDANGRDGITTCVPDGKIGAGGECVRASTTGNDNCAAGLFCEEAGGTCVEICSAGGPCGGNSRICVEDPELFTDVDGVGLCPAG